MTALAAAANRMTRRGTAKQVNIPMAAATTIFQGAIVCIDAGGNAVAGADTAGLQVAGVAHESKVNSGAAGVKSILVDYDDEWLFTASSITQAMLGDLMCIVDDNTVDDAAGPTNDIAVGRLMEFVTTTQGWVYVPGLTTL